MNDTIIAIFSAVVPLLVVALAGIGWLYRHERDRRLSLESRLNEKKAAIYGGYIENITSIFEKDENPKQGQVISEKRIKAIVKKTMEYHRSFLIYGSKDIISIQSDFMSYLYSGGKHQKLFEFEDKLELILNHMAYLTRSINVMRKELGHRQGYVTVDEIAKGFITDYVPGTFKGYK